MHPRSSSKDVLPVKPAPVAFVAFSGRQYRFPLSRQSRPQKSRGFVECSYRQRYRQGAEVAFNRHFWQFGSAASSADLAKHGAGAEGLAPTCRSVFRSGNTDRASADPARRQTPSQRSQRRGSSGDASNRRVPGSDQQMPARKIDAVIPSRPYSTDRSRRGSPDAHPGAADGWRMSPRSYLPLVRWRSVGPAKRKARGGSVCGHPSWHGLSAPR